MFPSNNKQKQTQQQQKQKQDKNTKRIQIQIWTNIHFNRSTSRIIQTVQTRYDMVTKA